MKDDRSVDSFLGAAKKVGMVDGSRSSFTIKPSLAREKILASRPIVDIYTILRLLDAGLAEWGYLPSKVTKFLWGIKAVQVRLPYAGKNRIATLIEELEQPFSRRLGATRLAQAIFLAAKKDFTVIAYLGSSYIPVSFRQPDIQFFADDLKVPKKLRSYDDLLLLHFHLFASSSILNSYRASPIGGCHDALDHYVKLRLSDQPVQVAEGFFSYRVKPFTAIRTYVASDEGLLLDICETPYIPYIALDEHTLSLGPPDSKSFLFRNVFSEASSSTLLHHFIGTPVRLGKQAYKAIFWVSSSDRPAQVHFYSTSMLSDPVPVKGPAGFDGMVFWPELTFDLWGSQLVRNDAFEKALAWAQDQVQVTSRILAKNIQLILQQLREGQLMANRSYFAETTQRVQLLWGQERS